MKKILMTLAIMIAILVSPGISEAKLIESPFPYNYKNGFLDDEDLIKSKNLSSAIDNDLNTSNKYQSLPTVSEPENANFQFNYPVYIKEIFFKYENKGTELKVRFFDGSSKTIELKTGNYEGYQTLDLKDVTAINIEKSYYYDPNSSYLRLYEIDFFGSYEKESKFYEQPHELKAETDISEIKLSWINPVLLGFKNILIYVNGDLKETLGTDVTSYQLTKLEPDTPYQIELIAAYADGGLSEKEILTVNTKKVEPEQKEIQSLTAKVTHERVDLSWQLPVYQDTFKYVNIYRGLADEDFDRYTLNTVKPSSKTIKKIFETNGTYFNDLTVEPATTYDYKLSVTETNLTETEGILTRVTTAEKPIPEIKNPVISKEGDDYIVTWSNDEGKVKIDVDGQTYKEVDASIKKLVIPAKDMKYDMFGKPLITITYTDKYGESSQPSKPSTSGPGFEDKELKLPFTIGTFLKVLMDLIKIVGPFILLSLAIGFAPKIMDLIKKANSRKGNK